MRRTSVLVLIVLLVGSAAATASAQTVTVDTVDAEPNQELEIALSVAGAIGLGAMHLEITFDPTVLTAVEAAKGPILGDDALIDFNADEPGRLVIGLISVDGIQADGTIAFATFQVIGEDGATTAIGLEDLRGWEGDTRFDAFVTGVPGAVTVMAGGEFPVAFILIGVAVLLVLLVTWMISRRRRRPAAAAAPQAAPLPPAPQPPPPPPPGS